MTYDRNNSRRESEGSVNYNGGGRINRKRSSAVLLSSDNSAASFSFIDLQLESEFRVLKSLIPGIAGVACVSEVEIIDACVTYIETLQKKLVEQDPGLLDNVHHTQGSCCCCDSSLSSSTSIDSNDENEMVDSKSKFTSLVRRNSIRKNQRRR